MSYADSARLSQDGEFSQRLTACISQEATTKPEDPLAAEVLRNTAVGTSMFMPWISTVQEIIDFYADPNGGGQSNVPDQAILSAVQADWAAVAAVNAGGA